MGYNEKYEKWNITDYDYTIAIFEDGSYKKVLGKDHAQRLNPKYIAQHCIVDTVGMATDPDRPIFSFEIFDKELNPTNISSGKWMIQNFQRYKYDFPWHSYLYIIDPKGEVREIHLEDFYYNQCKYRTKNLEVLICYIDLLNRYQHFPDWLSYDQHTENMELREKVHTLQLEIDRLNKVIAKSEKEEEE